MPVSSMVGLPGGSFIARGVSARLLNLRTQPLRSTTQAFCFHTSASSSLHASAPTSISTSNNTTASPTTTTTTTTTAAAAAAAAAAAVTKQSLLTPTQASHILATQRLSRPIAPHLTIYRPQIHSISSALQRNTGLVLSGGLYLFGIAYALNAVPLLHFSPDVTTATVALAATLGGLGWGVAGWMAKGVVAWTGSFHTINGVLGLVRGTRGVSAEWSLGSRERFVKVGWVVMGLSVVGAVGACAWF